MCINNLILERIWAIVKLTIHIIYKNYMKIVYKIIFVSGAVPYNYLGKKLLLL